jgi:AcrR family transcriptional regulator
MSTENQGTRRRYEKRHRAKQEEATRRRITEAAVTLHGSVGPARTTVSAVAEEAGVQRGTVYRHFPDEESLFKACSTHWAAEHPVPDPSPWRAIDDPEARLREGLSALYAFYDGAEPMLSNVFRDADLVPVVQAMGQARIVYLREVEKILVEGFPSSDHALRHAAIGLALDFRAWRVLTRDRGLSNDRAVELMTRAVCCAGQPGTAT